MYAHGRQGVNLSYERAVEYYEAAARQGMANAQLNLGVSYYIGDGVWNNPMKQHVSGT
jgi:TPR repeat protein